jgi:hypothetical protein
MEFRIDERLLVAATKLNLTCAFRPISPAALRALGETADARVICPNEREYRTGKYEGVESGL